MLRPFITLCEVFIYDALKMILFFKKAALLNAFQYDMQILI